MKMSDNPCFQNFVQEATKPKRSQSEGAFGRGLYIFGKKVSGMQTSGMHKSQIQPLSTGRTFGEPKLQCMWGRGQGMDRMALKREEQIRQY